MKTRNNVPMVNAVIAAALYAISMPVSKLLLADLPSTFMAALLYLGAGLGMLVIKSITVKRYPAKSRTKFTGKDTPYLLGMILLDVAAPISLMVGLTMTTSANASLLNNFEIVATSLIAMLLFKEAVNRRLWTAILLITASSILLSVEDIRSFSFSTGSLFVLLACVLWGFENNFTKRLSGGDPTQVVIVKGFGSGLTSLLISFGLKAYSTHIPSILAALILGFFAYGLSILFYIYAQRDMGAAKTSAYYAISPFIGAGLSFLILHEIPTLPFLIALVIMIIGAYLASADKKPKEGL